jgi:methyl-accepting chemotaxis protein
MKIARWFGREERTSAPRAEAHATTGGELARPGEIVYLYEGKPLKKTRLELSGLLNQLETDVALTLQMIKDTSQEALDRVEESIELSNRIQTSSRGLASLAVSARQTSDRLVETARQMESSNVEIERQVAGSDDFLEEARKLAGTASAQMRGLSDVARNISSVVDLIRAIARQTNLLALNATIEAARAGAAGKGFSVVATEVKTLAGQVQSATSDIARQIAALESAVNGSSSTMTRMAEIIARVDPVLDSIRCAAAIQVDSTRDVASRAVATADFADVVAQSAEAMFDLAQSATSVANNAGDAARTLDVTLERLNHRSMLAFRQAISEERREVRRMPMLVSCHFKIDGRIHETVTLDISEHGALLNLSIPGVQWSSAGALSLEGIGTVACEAINQSEGGLRVSFPSISAELKAAIHAAIGAENQRLEPHRRKLGSAAADLAAAFARAIATGDVKRGALLDSLYKAIPGTFPVQYESAALGFYEKAIPPILATYKAQCSEALFLVAYDRNAYLPVHEPEYSKPQVRHDIGWNELNARNRRIMTRARTLEAARNTDAGFVSLVARDMNDGTQRHAQLLAHPVYLGDALWGNVVMALPLMQR